jgi:uncharacterized metal-binding protein YceD (DUF177 family)
MPSRVVTKIDLRDLSRVGDEREIVLGDDFFSNLEQDEIVGGKVVVSLSVKERTHELFELFLKVEGEVNVPCDRCLEMVTLDIEAEDMIKIFGGDVEEHPVGDDIKLLEGRGYDYELSWDIYELIVVSLPLQRVHADGDCNAEMLTRICLEQDSEY